MCDSACLLFEGIVSIEMCDNGSEEKNLQFLHKVFLFFELVISSLKLNCGAGHLSRWHSETCRALGNNYSLIILLEHLFKLNV